jgi:predicted dehydrogenase
MKKNQTRRKFIHDLGLAGAGIPFLASYSTCNDDQIKKQAMNHKKDGKLGIALVGLGGYAGGQLAPALQQTEHCYLAGVVTGSPSKIPVWKEKYKIPDQNIYSYDNYDAIKENPDIDIIYVVLPNHLHAEYTIRGFAAGKHVICEKPMGLSVSECDAMITAAEKAGKKLSIGYRLHYDPYNLELVRRTREKTYGEIKAINTSFSITPQKGEWRLNKKMAGGGPLMDVGIYCLQAVCYVTGAEPVAVTATTYPVSDKEKFIDIEETLEFRMEMPGGLVAKCRTSYSENNSVLDVSYERGWCKLEPAYFYGGIKLSSSDAAPFGLPSFSQQAKQMDAMALAIKNNQESKTPGEMGRRDLQIIEAIYEAMRTGKRVVVKK